MSEVDEALSLKERQRQKEGNQVSQSGRSVKTLDYHSDTINLPANPPTHRQDPRHLKTDREDRTGTEEEDDCKSLSRIAGRYLCDIISIPPGSHSR